MTTPTTHSLAFFPVTLFGSVMGLSGLTLGLQHAQWINHLSPIYALGMTIFTSLIFMSIALTYLIKSFKFPFAMKQEMEHPVAGNFFAAFSISLLLLSIIYKDITPQPAAFLWYLGASLQLLLTIKLLNAWIHQEKWKIIHMNPAWFIPIVGNIIIPLGAPTFADMETGWFFFSVGFVFWIILQAIMMYRLFFHPPMAQILEPTLFIFIAPPAMGFMSYLVLNGGVLDNFARILFYTALFFALLLFSQTPRFIKVPFSVAWWAYTFPIAAIANASWMMYDHLGYLIYFDLAIFFMTVLSILILHLLFKTLILIKNKKLCLPPPNTPNQANTPKAS